MTDYPLLPMPEGEPGTPPPGHGGAPKIGTPTKKRQVAQIGPEFARLQNALKSDAKGLELRADPSSIAPERALVFEVAGSVSNFRALASKTPGLEFLGDEDALFDADDDFHNIDNRKGKEGNARLDKPVGGRLYMAMPDVRALRELVSLWDRWKDDRTLPHGLAQWGSIFSGLREIRPWGSRDRLTDESADWLRNDMSSVSSDYLRIEIDLWFRKNLEDRERADRDLADAISKSGGEIVHCSVIRDIGYHGVLARVPTTEIARLVDRNEERLAVCDSVMYIRPQTSLDVVSPPIGREMAGPAPDSRRAGTLPPIAALLDGVPIENHRLLQDRIDVDDPDDLGSHTVVQKREHGTAMASLILHGDRNELQESLSRRLYIRPVLSASGDFAREGAQRDRLFIDTIYKAVVRMKEGEGGEQPTAPDAFLVNFSVGIESRPFTGAVTPLARLLDFLAEKYGILFLVSAGNIRDPLPVAGFAKWTEFEDATPRDRQDAVLKSLFAQKARRTLLSPGETLNGITVGAKHDGSPTPAGAHLLDPYETGALPNITSALGLGYRKIVKPEIYMAGGRELVTFAGSGGALSLRAGGRYGLMAAFPDPDDAGNVDRENLTQGTSAATALATRSCHFIFDALTHESTEYIDRRLNREFYAVVIKAMLVHRSAWAADVEYLEDLYGPHDQGKHVERRDNVARTLGYGSPNIDNVLSCAYNRATLVGWGEVNDGVAKVHRIPLPTGLENVTEPRTVTVTVAWFSPIDAQSREYRLARLDVGYVTDMVEAAGVERYLKQPSHISTPRGTVFHTRYRGEMAVPFVDDGHIRLRVTCRAQGSGIDRTVRYGLAVTVEADGNIAVYDEIRSRLGLAVRTPAP